MNGLRKMPMKRLLRLRLLLRLLRKRLLLQNLRLRLRLPLHPKRARAAKARSLKRLPRKNEWEKPRWLMLSGLCFIP